MMSPTTNCVAVPQREEAILLAPENAPAGQSAGMPAIAAAGVVHDLGNLIQVAAAAVSILARAPDMPAERSEPILARAKASLEQAGALVRQTIGLIRDRMIAAEDTSVIACLAEVRALVDAREEAGLILEMDIEPDLPKVRCDPFGLQNAMLNLVFNARDAMEGSGVVTLQGRTIPHGPTATGVELRVSDTGVGMTLATISRVFDPFFTTKSDGLGGVGLSMVERFVRDASGEITIESEPGTGTTVTLRLPAIARAAAPALPTRNQQESDR